jgi:hypothetical protein
MVWTGSRAIVWGGLAGKSAFLSSGGLYDDPGLLPAATDFHTVTPCRLVDTRAAAGPALAGGSTRTFTVTGGTCGVPSAAVAVSVNVTAAEAAANGNLVVFPGNSVLEPSASTLHFAAGVNRANNAVVLLATDGSGSLKVKNRSADAVHLVLDVSGYFE